MYYSKLNHKDKTPKYKQIVNAIILDIEKGVLQKDKQLPSISELSEECYLARDTVEKAYRELKDLGYITSIPGKGFYIVKDRNFTMKVLLIFNKLSSYKKIIYYSFLNALGNNAKVDLYIHHYNAVLFQDIIENNIDKYHYFVIMPHFFQETDKVDVMKILKRIPEEELILLDKDIPELNRNCLTVYQDFENDIYGALESVNDLVSKYKKLILVFPSDSYYPFEIVKGFRRYCIIHKIDFAINENVSVEILASRNAYIVLEETDLAELIKKLRLSSYILGADIGILSFNETTLKELLNISVITTDHETMGRTAAALLLEKKRIKVKNPFSVIRRGSF